MNDLSKYDCFCDEHAIYALELLPENVFKIMAREPTKSHIINDFIHPLVKSKKIRLANWGLEEAKRDVQRCKLNVKNIGFDFYKRQLEKAEIHFNNLKKGVKQ